MTNKHKHKILTYLIATVWIANGLFCKVLNLVPRHEQIIGSILGDEFSRPMTILIGLSEIIMALWVLSCIKTRLNAISQMTVVATMNILEFIIVPDLLLWRRFNSVFAAFFVLLIFYNEFIFKQEINTPEIECLNF